MKFSLLIYGAPYAGESATTALHVARAVLARGHRIHRLFFYQDGVHNATSLAVAPQDESDLPRAWQTLVREHGVDAVVCIASALARGILDEGEAERYERGASNLLDGFQIGGLGLLVDAVLNSDRVLSFAP